MKKKKSSKELSMKERDLKITKEGIKETRKKEKSEKDWRSLKKWNNKKKENQASNDEKERKILKIN